jgi:hypothetical protein
MSDSDGPPRQLTPTMDQWLRQAPLLATVMLATLTLLSGAALILSFFFNGSPRSFVAGLLTPLWAAMTHKAFRYYRDRPPR